MVTSASGSVLGASAITLVSEASLPTTSGVKG